MNKNNFKNIQQNCKYSKVGDHHSKIICFKNNLYNECNENNCPNILKECIGGIYLENKKLANITKISY